MRIRIQHFRRMRIRIQADPDSGKILTKLSEGKQNEYFSSNFTPLNIFRLNSLPKILYGFIGNTNLHLYLVFCLNSFYFFADFLDPDPDPHSQCGSGSRSPSNMDPMWIRIRIRNTAGNIRVLLNLTLFVLTQFSTKDFFYPGLSNRPNPHVRQASTRKLQQLYAYC
jgi:hypothetical protein